MTVSNKINKLSVIRRKLLTTFASLEVSCIWCFHNISQNFTRTPYIIVASRSFLPSRCCILNGRLCEERLASALWCFHWASEKGHAGAAIAYGSLPLRGVQVPECVSKFSTKRGAAAKRARKNVECLPANSIVMAKDQFQITATAGYDLGLKWLQRLEEVEK